MTKKQFSIWMLAGCVSAGTVCGTHVLAVQPDGEMEFYDGQNGYTEEPVSPDDDTDYTGETWQTATETDGQTGYTGYTDETTAEGNGYADEWSEYSENMEYFAAEYDMATESDGSTEAASSEDTTEGQRSYKDDPFISIRRTDKVRFAEDYDILKKEDAERDFDLLTFEELPAAVSLDVPEVRQLPELPTGCESVALTMALEYEGFKLYKTTIAREFLIYNQETDNMAIGYIGDPFSEDGAGCFAPAIAATADSFFEDQEADYTAYDISGCEMEELLSFIEAGTPVVLWTTMYMAEPEFTEDTAEYNGETYRWYYQEHCVVLSGYDLENHTLQINDPLEGIVTRDYDEFKDIYDMIGRYAVVVKANTEE